MADTVEFELVSPQKLLKSQPVAMVVLPCSDGDIGVLPGHSPLIATVRPGVVDIHENGKVTERIFVSGGFAEVTTERCTLLAEEAIEVADLDLATAELRLADAQAAVEAAVSDQDKATAEAAVKTAEAMIVACAK